MKTSIQFSALYKLSNCLWAKCLTLFGEDKSVLPVPRRLGLSPSGLVTAQAMLGIR